MRQEPASGRIAGEPQNLVEQGKSGRVVAVGAAQEQRGQCEHAVDE